MGQSALPRDYQVTRVYRAEKIAEFLLINDYLAQTLDEAETLAFIDSILHHPDVLARWGTKKVRVEFITSRAHKNAYAQRTSGLIAIPLRYCNPTWVIHEVAHLLATKETEPAHGPGFAAIERYLYTQILGEEAGRTLDAAFSTLGVKCDDTQIPPIKYKVYGTGKTKRAVPGLVKGQASNAAATLRALRDSGHLEDDPELEKAATRIARRLDNLEKQIPKVRTAPGSIPETITIPTARLLRTGKKDDIAEVVLAAMRNHIHPKPLKPAPIDPRLTPKQRATRARRAAAKTPKGKGAKSATKATRKAPRNP